ncbi:hypothetical protein KI387_041947, partial [Taxus chinensis]
MPVQHDFEKPHQPTQRQKQEERLHFTILKTCIIQNTRSVLANSSVLQHLRGANKHSWFRQKKQ